MELFVWVCVRIVVLCCVGSGKSYTMMGSLSDDDTKGIIPRLCDNLFERIAEVSCTHTLLMVRVLAYVWCCRNRQPARKSRSRWKCPIWKSIVRK